MVFGKSNDRHVSRSRSVTDVPNSVERRAPFAQLGHPVWHRGQRRHHEHGFIVQQPHQFSPPRRTPPSAPSFPDPSRRRGWRSPRAAACSAANARRRALVRVQHQRVRRRGRRSVARFVRRYHRRAGDGGQRGDDVDVEVNLLTFLAVPLGGAPRGFRGRAARAQASSSSRSSVAIPALPPPSMGVREASARRRRRRRRPPGLIRSFKPRLCRPRGYPGRALPLPLPLPLPPPGDVTSRARAAAAASATASSEASARGLPRRLIVPLARPLDQHPDPPFSSTATTFSGATDFAARTRARPSGRPTPRRASSRSTAACPR